MEILDLAGIFRRLIIKSEGKRIRPSDLVRFKLNALKEYFSEKEWNQVISLLEKIKLHELLSKSSLNGEATRS